MNASLNILLDIRHPSQNAKLSCNHHILNALKVADILIGVYLIGVHVVRINQMKKLLLMKTFLSIDIQEK